MPGRKNFALPIDKYFGLPILGPMPTTHPSGEGMEIGMAEQRKRKSAAKSEVAMSIGYASTSSAGKGGAIVCVYCDDDWNLVHIRASKVGDNGIKPDTAYTLDKDGEFVEVSS